MNVGCGLVGVGAAWLAWKGECAHVIADWRAKAFLALNGLTLLYCLTATWNARATFSVDSQAFSYFDGVIRWLPTSYDRSRSFQFLLNSAAMFAFFWGVIVWIGAEKDKRSVRRDSPFPARPHLFLWVFSANGFLLALQGLLQRLSKHAELLWFRTPYSLDPAACFGPFAYRGNAADYLNLAWPVTFGFWYVLAHHRGRRGSRTSDGPELLLLPMFVLTATASFATLSRGGAAVASLMLLFFFGGLFVTQRSGMLRWVLGFAGGALIFLAVELSGTSLANRFRKAATDNLSGRTEIYENAQQIAQDFPWFGTGPNTFLSVYHLYRADPGQSWAAFLHDDWLETRVTFGRVGMTIILLQFAVLLLWTFKQRPNWVSPVFTAALLVSLAGCLIHAKRDFPFQTYGVFFTFVAVSALLVSAAVQPRRVASLADEPAAN